MLDYRENHVRTADGRLVEVHPQWRAEAERYDVGVTRAEAIAATPDEAWNALRAAIEQRCFETSRSLQLRPLGL